VTVSASDALRFLTYGQGKEGRKWLIQLQQENSLELGVLMPGVFGLGVGLKAIILALVFALVLQRPALAWASYLLSLLTAVSRWRVVDSAERGVRS